MDEKNYRFDLNPFVTDLTQIMKDITLKKYGKNIAVIAIYGSRAKGDYDPDSDLEFFAITDDEVKVDIEFTFNGIPIDIWSQTWKRIEEISKIDTYWILPAGSLASCKVIYTRSDVDKERFDNIIAEVKNPVKYYEKSLTKASETFFGMYGILGRLQLAKYMNDVQEARDACWNLIISVTYITGHLNSRYLTKNWGVNLDEVFSLEKKPDDLQEIINQLVSETDFVKMIDQATRLVNTTRQFMIATTFGKKEESKLEMLSTSDSLAYLNKIKKAARKEHIYAAGYAVHDFQPLVAKDLVRLEKNWDMASKFRLYSEYKELYEKHYANFFSAISNRDYPELIILADSLYDNLLDYNQKQNPDFSTLNEIREKLL